jgi:quercetin dioxygenase-like cupin family protein
MKRRCVVPPLGTVEKVRYLGWQTHWDEIAIKNLKAIKPAEIMTAMPMGSERVILFGPAEGHQLWTMGMLMTIKASASETGETCSVLEVSLPPNVGPPLHIHTREAELNYVLSGEISIRCGDDAIECGSGGFVYLPRGIPHAFKSGPEGAKMLAITMPGGLEGLYEAVGIEAESPTLPSEPPNIAGWLEHAPSFGLEIVGPPLS